MNFCSECGTKLGQWELEQNRCGNGHALKETVVQEHIQVAISSISTTAVAVAKTRKLPETPEEREGAYSSAISRLAAIFKAFGFQVINAEGDAFTVVKGPLTLDAKIVDNQENIAYITSCPDYDPDKAGKKGSGAIIQNGRRMFKSRDLLRVLVSSRQSVPIFVELRQNISDPELHICKAVMFILEDALRLDSTLHHALKSVDHLKDVPKEWLPTPGDVQEFPELSDLVDIAKQLPEPV